MLTIKYISCITPCPQIYFSERVTSVLTLRVAGKTLEAELGLYIPELLKHKAGANQPKIDSIVKWIYLQGPKVKHQCSVFLFSKSLSI